MAQSTLSDWRAEFRGRVHAAVKASSQRVRWLQMSDDELTLPMAQQLVRQWGIFTRHSRQCWAYVVGNCPIVEVRRFIVAENLWEEEAMGEEHSHFNWLVDLGEGVGVSRAEIEAATPLPSTSVAMLAWESLTKNRSWAEGITAKLVLERYNDPDSGRQSARDAVRWKKNFGCSDHALRFWSNHAEVDLTHGDVPLDLLGKYMDPADADAAYQAAVLSLQAWELYLDGIVASAQ